MSILSDAIARGNARRAAQLAAEANGENNTNATSPVDEAIMANATPVAPSVENENETAEAESSTLSTYESNCLSYLGKARFRGGDWAERIADASVSIIGAGGIGSWTALEVSRMQAKEIVIADGDKVEDVNLAGQMYRTTDIGQYKTDAVSRNIAAFCTSCNLISINRFITEEDAALFNPITITALDSMTARALMWKIYKAKYEILPEENRKACLFIDGRMNADTIQVFAFRMNEPEKIRMYEETALFSSEQADATVCSYKATSYMSTLIGSIIGGIIKQHFSAAELDHKWTIPLFTEISSEIGWKFKTTNGDWRA